MVSAVRPAGRSPTTVSAAVTWPGLFQRAFSAATAWSTIESEPGVERRQRGAVGGAQIDLEPRLERDGVDRRPAADAADVERRARRRRHREVADGGDGAAQRVDRVGRAEGAVAVPARPAERDLVAADADADVGDVQADAVDRHERVDRAGQLGVDEMPHAAEVAEAFFADGADERHGTGGLDRRSRQRVGDRDQDRQPAGVVADARPLQHRAAARDADVGALGEHGVEVRADDDVRPRRPRRAARRARCRWRRGARR